MTAAARGAAGLRATRIAFFVSGAAAATWAPLVPFAKARLGIGDATLGLVILCLGIGSVAAMPVAGLLTERHGCRAVVAASIVVLAASMPVVALAPTLATLAVAVAVFGAALGSLDVSMNTEAVVVERRAGHALMSGIHAFYSLGGVAGAAVMTALLQHGASPVEAAAGSAVVAILALGMAFRDLLPEGGGDRRLARPDRVALVLGLLCAASFLAEGAVADWGAVFLHAAHGFPLRSGGLAYGAFSVAMVAGRLFGDRVVRRTGGVAVVAAGGTVAALGYGLAIVAERHAVVLAGFAMIGLGASNIVPVLVTAVGRRSSMPPGLAVATAITFGYGGVLLGPAVLGLVAHWSSLSAAFGLVGLLLLTVAASARRAA